MHMRKSMLKIGKAVILDSGFCRLEVIIALRKFSACTSISISKEDINKSIPREMNLRSAFKKNNLDLKITYLVL